MISGLEFLNFKLPVLPSDAESGAAPEVSGGLSPPGAPVLSAEDLSETPSGNCVPAPPPCPATTSLDEIDFDGDVPFTDLCFVFRVLEPSFLEGPRIFLRVLEHRLLPQHFTT